MTKISKKDKRVPSTKRVPKEYQEPSIKRVPKKSTKTPPLGGGLEPLVLNTQNTQNNKVIEKEVGTEFNNNFITMFDDDLKKRIIILDNVLFKNLNLDTPKEETTKAFNDFFLKEFEYKEDLHKAFNSLDDEQKKIYVEKVKSFYYKITDVRNTFVIIHQVYRELRYFIKEQQKQNKTPILDSMIKQIDEIKPRTLIFNPLTPSELLDFEDNTINLIDNLLTSGSINMIYSKPGLGKSLLSLYQAVCLSSSHNFLNLKTKKTNVCYFDWENSTHTIQIRFKQILKGMNLNSHDLSLFFFLNTSPIVRKNNREAYIDLEFLETFEKFIKDNDIKVVYLDTIRRVGNFDENDSQIINLIYQDFFFYFRNKYDLTFIFIHHTSKNGENYRGSVDIEAICDTCYSLEKTKNIFKFKASKRRNAELEEIKLNIDFNEEEILFLREELTQEDKEETKLNEVKYKDIVKYIKEELKDENFSFTELFEIFKEKDLVKSRTSFVRALEWFCDNDILLKDDTNSSKPIYSKPKKEKVVYDNEIKDYLNDHFKNYDIIDSKKLFKMFNEQRTYSFLEKWISSGLIFEPTKGTLRVTEKYREEHPQYEEIEK